MNCFKCAIVLVIFELIICYKTFIEPIWLTTYWALTLGVHAILCTLIIILWTYEEYHIIQIARNRNRITPTSEDYAAILQQATRRKLSTRVNNTRGVSKPSKTIKSGNFRRNFVIIDYDK